MKEALVYGIEYKGDLVILPEQLANELAAEYRLILNLKTYRDARQARLQHLRLPGRLDAENEPDEDVPHDDEPYDPMAIVIAEPETEFPVQASTFAYHTLPEEILRLGHVDPGHIVTVPSFHISTTDEQSVVSVIRRLGDPIRRNDELIAQVDPMRIFPEMRGEF